MFSSLLSGRFGFVGTVVVILMIAGCQTTPATSHAVPASLTDVGEYGENIYDAAKAGSWSTASQKLKSLKKAAAELPADLPGPGSSQKKAQLFADISALEKSIPARDKQASIEKANHVTLVADGLSAPFGPKVPVDITRLDYLGRELEVWAGPGDLKRLQQVASEIQSTWSKVRPAIEAKGASRVSKSFSALVDRVAAAKTAQEYEASAGPLLDEVDNLEKVFK